MPLTTSSGDKVTIGRRLCTTRRGEIFTVTSAPAFVLKRYRQDVLDCDSSLERRLRVMISRFRAEWLEPDSHVNLAWPLEVVLDDGRFVGFLMPAVTEKEILRFRLIASPLERRLVSGGLPWVPGFTWKYLIGAAANLASVTHLLHEAGVVIGDFSADDLRVANDSRVVLLGCDSMQLKDRVSGEVFPALHCRGTSSVPLNPSYDLPALASHVHRLLAEGRNLTANLNDASDPASPDLLPDTLKGMFQRASDGNPASCPTAFQWQQTLVVLGADIVKCRQEPLHEYWSGLAKCPLCAVTASALSHNATSVGKSPAWLGSELHGRVQLGELEALSVTESEFAKVPHLRKAMTDEREDEVCALIVTPTFHDEDERLIFREASVMVRLEILGPKSPDMPQVWWMYPDRDTTPVRETRSIQWSSVLRWITRTVNTSLDYQRDIKHILAYGMKCSEAYWKLTRTPGREIKGSYELLMVIKMARNCTTEAAVEATGIIERRKYWVRRGRREGGRVASRINLEPGAIQRAKVDIRDPG